MSYLDTSVIIAYCVEGDPHHNKAVNIVEKLSQNKFYGSPITLVELYSVISRNIQKYELPPGIEEITNYKIKLLITVKYFLQLIPLHLTSDEAKLGDFDQLKLFHKFLDAIDLADKLKLRTLDLLHIVYAGQLARKGLIKYFITFDSDLLDKKEAILENAGVEVITE
jgi:predicted nucleic acid-binding protein